MSKLGLQGNLYHFVEDPSTIAPYGGYIRGWSNQLVVYNRNTNRLGFQEFLIRERISLKENHQTNCLQLLPPGGNGR